jgi:succinoglycan biosynthesis transport protein ExoP
VAAQDLQPFRSFGIPAPLENAEVASADLRSVLGVLLRHWKLIVIVPLLAIIPTYFVLKLVPLEYKSTAEILIVNPKLQSETGKTPSVFDIDAAAMSTEIALIQSKSLALRVAKELDLDKNPKFSQRGIMSQLFEGLGLSQVIETLGLSQVLETLGLSPREGSDDAGQAQAGPEHASAVADIAGPEQPSAALDATADDLRQRIKVDRLGLSYVLSISITTQDPALTQRILDAVAKNFFAEQREARADARQQAAGWLKNWVSELRDSLSETEGTIEKLKAESGLSDTGLAVNVTEQQTSELNKQLAGARAEVTEKKLRLEQARRLYENGGDIQAIPDVMASVPITQLRQQQSELKWREEELSRKYGDRHVEAVAVRAQLASVNKRMNDEAQHIITNLQSTYDLALRREHSVETGLQKVTTAGSDNTSAYAQLRSLQPAADAKRKLFEQALGDLDQLSRRSTADDEGGRIIAPASLPRPPSALRRVVVYIIVGVFATGLAAATAFLVEYLHTGFTTHAMTERSLGYPVLSMIPVIRRRFPRISSDVLAQVLISERRSQLSTSVETARIVVGLSNAGTASKVVLLTSAIPGEGKSVVARLLATSSALSGRRTALVDCDLHHSSLSKQFGRKHLGLAQVLDGETDLASVTAQDPATGLFVIPAGSNPSKSPADLLSSDAMRELIGQLRLQYDYVVMDASPVLPVVDSLALAAIADKIVMIVEWGRTSRTSVSEALKALRFAGHSVCGIVLNKVDYKRLASYGYGFGRDYTYGSRFRAALGKY